MAERAIVLLGGAGFIGGALARRLADDGGRVIAAVRAPAALGPGIEIRVVGRLSAASDWPAILAGASTVVHLASRAHAPPGSDPSWIEHEAATAGALGRAARAGGIERVVFLSSIKVHGEDSGAGSYRASDPPAPADAYGRAKTSMEQALRESGVPLVVLRPPLVFGPGVKGNFRALMGLMARGVPLPLASVVNRRSMILLDNLVDLIEVALSHEAATGGAFLMRQERDISTPELLRLVAHGLGHRARLVPCPPALLRAMARALGRGGDAERLVNSLSVDDAETRARLGWEPRVSLEDGVAATCRWFRDRARA